MVRINDPKFVSMSRAEKIRKLDRLKAKADDKLQDQTFYNQLITDYKAKLDSVKAKL